MSGESIGGGSEIVDRMGGNPMRDSSLRQPAAESESTRDVALAPPRFKDERAFTRWVKLAAEERGWLVAHFGSSVKVVRRPDGSTRTIPDRDASGFPDLVLVHPTRGLLFAELKRGSNTLRGKQIVWLEALGKWARVRVWRDRDWRTIVDVLDGVAA